MQKQIEELKAELNKEKTENQILKEKFNNKIKSLEIQLEKQRLSHNQDNADILNYVNNTIGLIEERLKVLDYIINIMNYQNLQPEQQFNYIYNSPYSVQQPFVIDNDNQETFYTQYQSPTQETNTSYEQITSEENLKQLYINTITNNIKNIKEENEELLGLKKLALGNRYDLNVFLRNKKNEELEILVTLKNNEQKPEEEINNKLLNLLKEFTDYLEKINELY